MEDAESREEKRWMERRNTALQSKHKRKEKIRINTLVEQAERLDPRVKAHNDAMAQRKAAMKKERQAERKKLLVMIRASARVHSRFPQQAKREEEAKLAAEKAAVAAKAVEDEKK